MPNTTLLNELPLKSPRSQRPALNRTSPAIVVLLTLILTGAIFLGFDLIETTTSSLRLSMEMRMVHLLRGFLATSIGMMAIWIVLHRKEQKLSCLQDAFEAKLAEQTRKLQELAAASEKEALRQSAIFSAMGESVILIDPNGKLTDMNDRATTMLGLTTANNAQDLFDRLVPLDTDSRSPIEALLQSRTRQTGQATYRGENQELAVSWTLAPVRLEEQSHGIVLTVADVSERERLQKTLSKQYSDFMTVINHRMRNPIIATERAASLLLAGDFGTITEAQQQVVCLMRDSSREIDRLLTTLLDIYTYRNGAKTLQRQTTNLRHLLDSIIREVESERIRYNVALSVTCPEGLTVHCDSTELAKLLKHVTENAIKFARSQVAVSAECTDGNTGILISDDGPGIPEKDRQRLFESFYCISADGKYAAVTGVGLCLCAEIAKAHNATIECKCTEVTGTTITIEFGKLAAESLPLGLQNLRP